MSVRSVPVADKLEQQNVQETLSEGRLGTQLRRSSRVKVPSNIDFESRTAERAVMRIRIIFSLSVMQFQTFLELSYNL